MNAVAYRPHVHVFDAQDGTRWRGAILESQDATTVVIRVLAEAGSPLRYRCPTSKMSGRVGAPLVCRMTGEWPYRIAEVRSSHFASPQDAWEASQGTPGIYGVVPLDIKGEKAALWTVTERSAEFDWL